MPLDQFAAYFSNWNNIFYPFSGKRGRFKETKNAFLARFQLHFLGGGGGIFYYKTGQNEIFCQNVGGKSV